MTVIDASAFVTAVASSSGHTSAAQLLQQSVLRAPAHFDVEVVSALRGLAKAGRFSPQGCLEAIAILQDLRIEREPHGPLLERIWELRHNHTPYDAAYVALAEALGVPLVTGDRRLAQAPGTRCRVELVEG